MKILGIIGSKRKNGNTSILANKALEAAKLEGAEVESIYLGEHNIKGCTGCQGCEGNYKCVINDDMQKIYPKLIEADAIILGSPTYFYNVTSDVKAFIDRCYCFEMFDKDDRSVWLGLNEVLGRRYATVIAICEQESEDDMGYTAEAMSKPLEALGYRIVDKVKVLRLFGKGEASDDNVSLKNAENAGNS